MGRLGLADCAYMSEFLFLLLLPAIQLIADLLVQLGAEKSAVNLFLVGGFSPKKLHEFALGDHADLHELLLGKPYNLEQFFVALLARIFGAVRHDERDFLCLGDHSRSFFLCAHVSRISAHCVHVRPLITAVGKCQLDIGLRARGGKLAVELCAVLHVS